MKKFLFPIFVLLVFLHPKTTFVPDGKSFHRSEVMQPNYSAVQADAQTVCLDLNDIVTDISDDTDNDSGKKIYSLQNIASSTCDLVARPFYNQFRKSKTIARNTSAFQSPLYILIRVFRI